MKRRPTGGCDGEHLGSREARDLRRYALAHLALVLRLETTLRSGWHPAARPAAVQTGKMTKTRSLAGGLLALAALSVLLGGCRKDLTEADVVAAMRQVIDSLPAPGKTPDLRWRMIQAVYRERKFEPLWTGLNHPNDRGMEFITADDDWTGTRVGFHLEPRGDATWMQFRHTGWPTTNEHYRISCNCWALYLRVLRRFLEHGETVPYDQRLDV